MGYNEKKKKLIRLRENGFLLIAMFVMQILLLALKLLGADIHWLFALTPLWIILMGIVLYAIWLMVYVIYIALHSAMSDDKSDEEDEDYDG